MNFSRNHKAFYSAWAIVLVALGGWAFGAYPLAGAVLVLMVGILLWVVVLRATNPGVQPLPLVERFNIGDGPEPGPDGPSMRAGGSTVSRTEAPSGRTPPPDQLSELSVVIPADAEEQARLAAERKARDEQRAAERDRARRERDEAKTAEKARKRQARDEAAAARRAEEEARRSEEQAEAERQAGEQAEAERIEADRQAADQADAERAEAE